MVQDGEGVRLCCIVLSAAGGVRDARGEKKKAMEAAGGGSTDTQRAAEKFIDETILKTLKNRSIFATDALVYSLRCSGSTINNLKLQKHCKIVTLLYNIHLLLIYDIYLINYCIDYSYS